MLDKNHELYLQIVLLIGHNCTPCIIVFKNTGNKLLGYGWRGLQGEKRIQILYTETW